MLRNADSSLRQGRETSHKHASRLLLIDVLIFVAVFAVMMFLFYEMKMRLGAAEIALQLFMACVCIFGARFPGGIYRQIWRYSGTSLYMRLVLLDALGGLFYLLLNMLLRFFLHIKGLGFLSVLSMVSVNLLCTISSRLLYQYLYEYSSQDRKAAVLLRKIVSRLIGEQVLPERAGQFVSKHDAALPGGRKINVAIVGAGRVGVLLAEELLNNPRASYQPCCFIDIDAEKIGRYIHGIRVLSEAEATTEALAGLHVEEIIFALPDMGVERKRQLYDYYRETGCRLKVYDYPVAQAVEAGKRQLRAFDIEELLFRKPMDFSESKCKEYYQGKTILITGGGGSIGSELCRQIARMNPGLLLVLDVYENGAYDIQQELRIAYGSSLNIKIEIASVCDRRMLEKTFSRYRPQIVLHAAAHKHVPLMERNCCEAVRNNVFGTLNVVELSEQYGVEKFIMVSTDKAVNPTNVMGATKRMCEMIVQSRNNSKTSFSATRFGNVLGSNGSVIPLFKRQIAGGGPLTITDKRIIRYFMTIPEASQLVLQSGAMARNGELYVLDMGKPVKILDLAENMIRLSGLEPYRDIDIVETGLRPGEKLYEELLIKTEELDKTENSMIFIERDQPLSKEEIDEKLALLRRALDTWSNSAARKALMEAVPTYHSPEEVNAAALEAEEMQIAAG